MDLLVVKQIHMWVAIFYTLTYGIKSILFLSGKKENALQFKKKTFVAETIASVIFLVTGFYMLAQIGMGNIGVWFHIKFTLVLVAIPLGIVGYKKENKVLIGLSLLMFITVLCLALGHKFAIL